MLGLRGFMPDLNNGLYFNDSPGLAITVIHACYLGTRYSCARHDTLCPYSATWPGPRTRRDFKKSRVRDGAVSNEAQSRKHLSLINVLLHVPQLGLEPHEGPRG